MRLGISSYTYGWAVGVENNRPPHALTALDLVDRASAFGVGVLQICDNLPPETYNDVSVLAIARHAAEKGVQLELGTRGSRPSHLRRFLCVAARLDSPILRVVVDTPDDQPSEEELVRRIREVRSDLEARNITLAIENHDRFRAKSLAKILEQVDSSHVGICLDTVNSFGALEGPEVVVDTLGPFVVNLHLKDFAVQRFPHLMGFTIEGRPAGQGMLNVPWLLDRLKDLGRDPNAIIELWTPPALLMDDTIRKEAEWAQLSVQTLRQWIKQ